MDKPQAHAAGVLCRFHSTYLGLGWNSELCLFWRGLWATFRACSCCPCSPLSDDMCENMLYLNTKKLLWIDYRGKEEGTSFIFSLSYCCYAFWRRKLPIRRGHISTGNE